MLHGRPVPEADGDMCVKVLNQDDRQTRPGEHPVNE
jgi:hypothetical protein